MKPAVEAIAIFAMWTWFLVMMARGGTVTLTEIFLFVWILVGLCLWPEKRRA